MIRVVLFSTLMFAGLVLSSAAAPAPVQVRASVDRTAIWVGDRVTYAIDIVCGRGVEILLDDLRRVAKSLLTSV